MTRSKNTRSNIIILVIIEVLLNLNKFTEFRTSKFFTCKNLVNKRFILIKLTSSSNTTNPFVKTYIRLSIINSCVAITIYKSFSLLLAKSTINKLLNKSLKSFFILSYSINNCYSNKFIKLLNFMSTIKSSRSKRTRNNFPFSSETFSKISYTIRNTRTLNFFCSLKKCLTIFIKLAISFKEVVKVIISNLIVKNKFSNILNS